MNKKGNSANTIMGSVGIILFILSLILLIIVIFNKQTNDYKTNLTCDQIEKGLILGIAVDGCTTDIHNNVFGLKWNFTDSCSLNNLKDYYKENCLQ